MKITNKHKQISQNTTANKKTHNNTHPQMTKQKQPQSRKNKTLEKVGTCNQQGLSLIGERHSLTGSTLHHTLYLAPYNYVLHQVDTVRLGLGLGKQDKEYSRFIMSTIIQRFRVRVTAFFLHYLNI